MWSGSPATAVMTMSRSVTMPMGVPAVAVLDYDEVADVRRAHASGGVDDHLLLGATTTSRWQNPLDGHGCLLRCGTVSLQPRRSVMCATRLPGSDRWEAPALVGRPDRPAAVPMSLSA